MISYSCEELGVSKTLVIRDFVISNDQMNSDAIRKLEFRTSSSGHEIGDFVFIEQLDQNYCFEIVGIREDGKSHILSFKKTKYERPYKLETIKAKYPEKIYKKLVGDRCHAWRARTGIDMIHLEPDDAEQKRTCKNWRLLPEKYRKASDKKSIELFGCDNLSHEKMLMIDRLHKLFDFIHYGWRNPETGRAFQNEEEFGGRSIEDVWRLGTPDQTIKAECGNCYDTVAISREYLTKAGIKFRVFFTTTADSKFDGERFTEAPTHTFLIYQSKADNMWYWLEGSWGPFKKNKFKSNNPSELIKWIGIAMANATKKDCVVFELSGYPKYGCDMTEFERFCRKGAKVGAYKPEKGTDR